MKASAALVLGADAAQAGATGAAEALMPLGTVPTLAVVFASPHYADEATTLVNAVRTVTGAVPTIGCVAQSVVGGPREIETGPAVSVLMMAGTGTVETFSVNYAPADGGFFDGYSFAAGGPHLLLCEPFNFPAGTFAEHLNTELPGSLVTGGVAWSAAPGLGARLFLDGEVLREGAVGVRMPGVHMDLLVAQGCRPIGNPFTVTRAEGNILHELGGKPPFERLQEMVSSLSERDRRLLANGGLQVGRVIDEYRTEQRQGDFLIRNVLGVDPASGAVVVGDELEVGETVQFHVRDAASADEDLRETLERAASALQGQVPAAALVFTCNGRGEHLFGEGDHDAGMVAKMFGEVPATGCFCAGELGPVGGKNFLHRFTASIALLRATDNH